MVSLKLLLLIVIPLGVTEAVELEAIKLIGIAISAGSAMYAARQAARNRRQLSEVQREQRARRREVRDPEHDVVHLVEDDDADAGPPPEDAP